MYKHDNGKKVFISSLSSSYLLFKEIIYFCLFFLLSRVNSCREGVVGSQDFVCERVHKERRADPPHKDDSTALLKSIFIVFVKSTMVLPVVAKQ